MLMNLCFGTEVMSQLVRLDEKWKWKSLSSVWLFATPQPIGLLCPWNSPGLNTGVGCLFLLQGIFPTQGSNLLLLHWRWILYHWATREVLLKCSWHPRHMPSSLYWLFLCLVCYILLAFTRPVQSPLSLRYKCLFWKHIVLCASCPEMTVT